MRKKPHSDNGKFNLPKEALIASGVKEGDRIADYLAKLDQLNQQFVREMKPSDDLLNKASLLFRWLWLKKPARYQLGGSFGLDEVIDAQLSKDTQTVGNCLGLTLLYNSLLLRMGIKAEALYLEDAFEIGPHVLTILRIRGSMIDVENILPNGFGYKGHVNNPSRIRWQDKDLVADIYHSAGNESFQRGDLSAALNYYNAAITLNPHYERACVNRAILLDKIKMEKV